MVLPEARGCAWPGTAFSSDSPLPSAGKKTKAVAKKGKGSGWQVLVRPRPSLPASCCMPLWWLALRSLRGCLCASAPLPLGFSSASARRTLNLAASSSEPLPAGLLLLLCPAPLLAQEARALASRYGPL